jgi:Mce-associated membrane protein
MSVATVAEVADGEDPAPTRVQRSARRSIRGVWGRSWRVIAVVMIVTVAAAFLATVYLVEYRTDQQTTVAGAAEAIDAASSGTVALLSYAPETIDDDLAESPSLMTGEFLTYYSKFSTEVIAPAVRDKGVTATAQVVRAAPMEIRPEHAKVLLFLNQQTSSRDRPNPAPTAGSVAVSMTKVDGTWLISALDPV